MIMFPLVELVPALHRSVSLVYWNTIMFMFPCRFSQKFQSYAGYIPDSLRTFHDATAALHSQ
jgi:hypothetical protein